MANEQGAGRGRGNQGAGGRGGGNQGAGSNQQAAAVIAPMPAAPRHIPNDFQNVVFSSLFRKSLTKTDLKQLRFTGAVNLEAFTHHLIASGVINGDDNKVTIGVTLFLDGQQQPGIVFMTKGVQHYYYITWKSVIGDRFTLNQQVDVWAAVINNQVKIFVEHAV